MSRALGNFTAMEQERAAKQAAENRKLLVTAMIAAGGLMVAAVFVAGIFVLVRLLEPPPATFVAKPPVAIPPKILEQKMATAEMEALSSKPTFDDKMASMRPTDFALPDLPPMPVEDMMPMDPSSIISDTVMSMVGQSGVGMGAGSGLGGAGGFGEGVSFFGLTSNGKSVVILFDVSKSVLTKADKAGIPITKIREETMLLLQKLSINVTFNLIQFTRGYLPFKPQLVQPTDSHRKEAQAWMEKEFRTGGTLSGSGVVNTQAQGFVGVLEAALKMNPDIVFIISDGDFQRGAGTNEQIPMEDIQKVITAHSKTRTEPTVINFVGFEMKDEHRKDLSAMMRRTGGRLREIGK